MNDTKEILGCLISEYCDELRLCDIKAYENYNFSQGFESKMEKLLKVRRKPYYPIIKTTGRKVAAVIAAAALLGGATVAAYGPARNAVKNFFVEKFNGYSTVRYLSDNFENDMHKKTIEYCFTIIVPDEYVLCKEQTQIADEYCVYTYFNSDFTKSIVFSQYVKDVYSSQIDNEKAELLKKEDISGNEVLVYSCNNNVMLIWDNGEYVFELSGNMDEEELMKIYYTLN